VRAESSIEARSPASGRGAASAVMLKTELLTVRFGGLAALSEINFELAQGAIHAIIGPNGAGVLRPTGGRILFNGEEISGLPSNAISQKGIARSYQITNILPNASTMENVRIAAQSRRHGWNMIAHHGAFADINRKAEAALDAVGLLGKASELASNLSHGEQRNLEIGIALATEPKLLCLDEPTAGMSAAETSATAELIRRIGKDLTILIVEHDMEVVMGLCDRITVLHYGRILAEGTPEEIQENPKVLEVYLKT
jgi:branched-chain amino acid transport system ATP-binding protein